MSIVQSETVQSALAHYRQCYDAYDELVASLAQLRANMKYVRGKTKAQKNRTLMLGMKLLWQDARREAKRRIAAFRKIRPDLSLPEIHPLLLH